MEHPINSTLWPAAGLPEPGRRDEFGGSTLPIHQHDWRHRARKATWLYIVGCELGDLPSLPLTLAEITHVVSSIGRRRKYLGWNWKPQITHAERQSTPPALAEWLCELARRCVRPRP